MSPESFKPPWLGLILIGRFALGCEERRRFELLSFDIEDDLSPEEELLQYRRAHLFESMRDSAHEHFVLGCLSANDIHLTTEDRGRYRSVMRLIGSTLFSIQSLDASDRFEIKPITNPELVKGLLLTQASKDIKATIKKAISGETFFKNLGTTSENPKECFIETAAEAFLGWVKLRMSAGHSLIQEAISDELDAFLNVNRGKSIFEMTAGEFGVLIELSRKYPMTFLDTMAAKSDVLQAFEEAAAL